MREARPLGPVGLLLTVAAALPATLVGCGGSDSNPPPPPAEVTTLSYDAHDPCAAKIPLPSDVFRDDSGLSEQASCPPPSDPIEAAVQLALADEGAPIDSKISIPADGTIDLVTLTASAAFSLTTGSDTGPLPSTLLFHRSLTAKTSTLASSWSLVPYDVTFDSGVITLTPKMPLEHGGYYVAITTDAIKDQARPSKQISAAPATKLLVGSEPIGAGSAEGIDAATAARLERERQRLAPLVGLLANAKPALVAGHIRSIQGFTAALGFQRMQHAADDYHAAATAGRITYRVDTTGGDIAPADVYPMGTPASAYDQVGAFRRGTIKVPRVLGDDGRVRADWTTNVQMISVPFLLSLPMGGGGYRAAIYLPGFGRSKLDAREIANAFAGAPRAAVMGIDLRCHGDRALDSMGLCKEERTAAELAALVDMNSNGNPERAGPDGVPDNSGAGFFNGDARALRDGQIAAAIEVMHIIETFQRGTAFMTAGLSPSTTDIHVIAHGHSAQVAIIAASLARGAVRTVTLTSAGAGIPELIGHGPGAVRDAFDATLPAGITAAQRSAYLTRLDGSVLEAVSISAAGAIAKDRFIRSAPGAPRILLAYANLAQYVSTDARQALKVALGLDAIPSRVSAHHGDCDDFYQHQCQLGDNIAWVERARDQLATFAGSEGVTVLSPAQ